MRALTLLLATALTASALDGNRLTYLDSDTPFWPSGKSPKFITPQWIGEPGVDAAVILAIDDMRDTAKYEAFLRPILDRLKRIDGRAPVSIMTNNVPPGDPQLQRWLKEGLSLEVHTLTHPCPCLGRATFEEAQRTYHGGVDLLASVPNNKPVAFRMPCCDSMNSASPRFFAEIFNRTSEQHNMLSVDSSVFVRPSGKDGERFAKYFPSELKPPTKISLRDYAGFIEDYPYPYVVGKLCWEFPCITPSDWQAYNAIGAKNPETLADWKAALDWVVGKQGVMTTVFHPHGWSSPEQWVEFIDYAQEKYGKRVKFLTFREALERIEKNALRGGSLRPLWQRAGAGEWLSEPARLLDVDGDGFMDVLAHRDRPDGVDLTRVWRPKENCWHEARTPFLLETVNGFDSKIAFVDDARFGVVHSSGAASALPVGTVLYPISFTWYGERWEHDDLLVSGLSVLGDAVRKPRDVGIRFRDFDNDGVCELVVNRDIFSWSEKERQWKPAGYSLPDGCSIVDDKGRDNGLRFVDLNGDGYDDVFQSNDSGYAIHLWAGKVKASLGWKAGWPHLVRTSAIAHSPQAPLTSTSILPFVKDGRDNGAWFHNGHAVWQNEDTVKLEAHTLRRPFKDLIAFDVPPPMSPEDSLTAMRPRPGFSVELVAAEPLLSSPVAFEWDARGRLWVVEMRDYPLGMDGKGKPGGRIKVLTDSRGDGHYDTATIFAEDIPYPTGIFPWRDGVIIASAPDILFLEDKSGSGKADTRTVLFTGFTEGNQQHRINGFDWGLDGWLYGANGDSGGNIVAADVNPRADLPDAKSARALTSAATNVADDGRRRADRKPVSISGRDFRFRPDTGEFEAESGSTQFGRHRDDWENWFGNNNPTWLWHYTLEDRYIRRNPRLAVKTTKQMLANYADSTRVFTAYPKDAAPIRFNQPQSLGHVTSSNSATPYRDELFGREFANSVFISEPVHNVVHREVLGTDGASFTSRRADDEQDREFLASLDAWFRPVMTKTGPDGALYVADVHRFVLEHPEWIAPETQSRLELRAGAETGRIFRVLPTGAKLRPIPNLAKLDNAALAAALDSPNGWQRDTAQRVLMERDAKDAALLVRKLAISAVNPKVRVQALATLGTLKSTDAATIRTALRDTHPQVRVQALRASEALAGSDSALLTSLLACADDPEFVVRRQFALTLGEWHDERAQAALQKLADREGEIAQMRLAILSSLTPESALFKALNATAATPGPVPTLPKASAADRAKVVAGYAAVAALKGDPQRGHIFFSQQCAICHRLKNEGMEVGPDLAMVSDKPDDWLLTAIFDPNAAVEPRYQALLVKLKNGTEFSGIVAGETANNLTLKLPGGSEFPVLRSDIAEEKPAGRSLMPEGLETVLKPQDVADVIAWLRTK
jgi:putative membrane-bound dehydrogenase-like protein